MEKLTIGTTTYLFTSLPYQSLGEPYKKFPYSLKVLIENLVRNQPNQKLLQIQLQAILQSQFNPHGNTDIPFYPARVLMQDFTGVPAVVDLAAMRDAIHKRGDDPTKINPLIPVDLVIDHSVTVDFNHNQTALKQNVDIEYQRNFERYKFLKWAQKSFHNFRVVPPGMGICHQVNLEYLAKVVWTKKLDDGSLLAYPDTVVGTDSHTTMINALGVLGWGVGGIEAEAAMLGQPLTMLVPQVIGVHLKGKIGKGVTATDLVLAITHTLRKKGVVGKFVEFFGEGLNSLPLADRATIANMAPEYGATCGFFPIDHETIKYLELSGRSADHIKLVETYAKIQGLWRDEKEYPHFAETLEIDVSQVTSLLAGPKRPQDKIMLQDIKNMAHSFDQNPKPHHVENHNFTIQNNDVVLAAITSCTNTSNPSVMIAAGLVARKARTLGLQVKPWVKTSLAPGSQVVTDYLEQSGLMSDLNEIGFYLVGYGCTTCIGNSGPLQSDISNTINQNDLMVSSVLSGNRNFEGRIHPQIKANYLASPPLVVAFALVGTTNIDLTKDPIAITQSGQAVYLSDLWPSHDEIGDIFSNFVNSESFVKRYSCVFEGDDEWQKITIEPTTTYHWNEQSTYVKLPPYVQNGANSSPNTQNGRILALLGDSITTDHISPAGSIKQDGPAGLYLKQQGVMPIDFNSYGARRGNHEVMMRGTFANIRLKNEMLDNISGGMTYHFGKDQSQQLMPIYDAAMLYQQANIPLVIIAGKEYGTGSSRDWAAKGTALLGVKAVIAESFERIHRSNLIGMGVLPLQFLPSVTRLSLGLTGNETISLRIQGNSLIQGVVECEIYNSTNKNRQTVGLLCRIDTSEELNYFQSGGILPFILKEMCAN